MTSRRRNLFVILLMAGLLLVSWVIIATKPVRLGLDLKGGIELVYQAQPTADSKVTPEAVDRSVDVIRDRVDQLGVAEPEIQRIGNDQIAVGLPGVKDLNRAKRIIGSTAQLYMYDFAANVIPPKLETGANSTTKEQTRPHSGPTGLHKAVQAAHKQKPVVDRNNTTPCLTPKRPGKCDQFYLFDRGKKLLAGPDVSRSDLLSQFNERLPKGAEIITVPIGTIVVQSETPADAPEGFQSGYYVLKDNPEVKGTQVTDPKPGTDSTTNTPNVSFSFKSGGAGIFHDVTRRLAQRARTDLVPGQQVVPQTFAIVLDRKIESRASIDPNQYPDGIDGRTGAQITGLNFQEAQDLATVLKTGALPVNLKAISQVQVSASLGKQALDQGLTAGIVGLIFVVLFLLAFYRLLGAIAVLALVVYGVLFLMLIKLIPITLTLPGIAGLILTVGVAADANVVIFERVKEELRAGRSTLAALSTGYSLGVRTIIDANVVTLITAFILFVLATAGVKGFAFTLMIGTIVSFLTAVLFTQAVLGTMGRSRWLRSPGMLGAGERHLTWRFDFMGRSRYFFAMSGAILMIGSIALATKGLNFGIDFESGTRVTASLSKSASVEQVRDAIEPLGLNDAKIQQAENRQLGPNVVQISTHELGPEGVKKLQDTLDRGFGVKVEGFSSESVGPTFGRTVARSAIYAIMFSLLLIMGYVALRFSGKFAIPVVIALLHDLLITTGVYALVGRQVSTATVAALLTILGYSLYDTVIVFDRVRENEPRMPRAAFSQIVNRSMSEVLTRTLVTGLSTIFPVVALLVFGGETLKDFAFALLVGILSGAYSSIFIASPVLTEWKEREPANVQRRRRIIDELGYVPAYATVTTGGVPHAPAMRAPAPATAPEPDGAATAIEPEGVVEEIEDAEVVEQIEGTQEAAGVTEPTPAPAARSQSKGAQRKRRSKRQQRRRKHGRNR